MYFPLDKLRLVFNRIKEDILNRIADDSKSTSRLRFTNAIEKTEIVLYSVCKA
jgi:hypothetical protein